MSVSSHKAEFPQEPGVAAAREGLRIDAEAAQVRKVLLEVVGEPLELVLLGGRRSNVGEVIECHA